jgi:hypothetical protein
MPEEENDPLAYGKERDLPTPHIDDFDEETIKAIWYEKTEYDTMKVGFVATIIKKMMRGEPIAENNESTIRGLEFRNPQELFAASNKLAAITYCVGRAGP